MRHSLVLALTVAGCYRPAGDVACQIGCASGACPAGLSCGNDQRCYAMAGTPCDQVDAAVVEVDAPIEPIDVTGAVCLGTGPIIVCFDAPPADMLAVGSINTDDNFCRTDVTTSSPVPVCVIAGQSLMISTARITGSKPLVLVATGQITITGPLDVSSDALRGAGALVGCVPAVTANGTPGQSSQPGGGGGAGGSFQGAGGAGGAGGGGDVNTNGGGLPQGVAPVPTVLRSGCPGGNGGASGTGATVGGTGGNPGGVVALIASNVVVDAVIDASGAGGAGGPDAIGGGGGGAGGLIVIDAPEIQLTGNARLHANGGGGGGGSSSVGGAGGHGGPSAPALGGMSDQEFTAGRGGAGSFTTQLAGTGAITSNAGCSAGGGGGGAGYILLFGNVSNSASTISPPARIVP